MRKMILAIHDTDENMGACEVRRKQHVEIWLLALLNAGSRHYQMIRPIHLRALCSGILTQEHDVCMVQEGLR